MERIGDKEFCDLVNGSSSMQEAMKRTGYTRNGLLYRIGRLRDRGSEIKIFYSHQTPPGVATGHQTPPGVDAAYAAGVFDVAGKIDIVRLAIGGYSVRLKITTTKREAIDAIHARWGGEIRELGGAFQLGWGSDDQGAIAFASAIAKHTVTYSQQMATVGAWLESRAYTAMYEAELVNLFGIENEGKTDATKSVGR